MKNLDIWLCRVLLHARTREPMNAHKLNDEHHQLVMARVIGGELGTLPDGTIIEPVQSFRSEPEANDARERALADNPGDDYRVVVTMRVQ